MGDVYKTIVKQETVNIEIDAEVKSFSCNHCVKSFSQRTNHMIHQGIHTEKSFTCNHCNECFSKNLIL